MHIVLNNRLVDSDYTREELLERVVISNTSKEDYEDICTTIAKAFNLPAEEVELQLIRSRILIDQSVKLIDIDTHEIYGLLIFCDFPIAYGSPLMKHSPQLGKFLLKYKQLYGHSFIIDERLRGSGLDKLMIKTNFDYLRHIYDFVWLGVEKSLKSNCYWERFGFMKFFSTKEASFYIMPLRESWLTDIYCYTTTSISNSVCKEDEKNNSN